MVRTSAVLGTHPHDQFIIFRGPTQNSKRAELVEAVRLQPIIAGQALMTESQQSLLFACDLRWKVITRLNAGRVLYPR